MEALSTKKMFDYEMTREELQSPEHSMRVSLARSGKRNFAKSIFFAWPNAEAASRRLAGMLTHTFPNEDGHGFLLDEALCAATLLYEQAVNSNKFTERMAMYLKAMLDVAADGLVRWDVHGIQLDGSTTAWQVGSTPLHEWVKKRNVQRVVFTKRATRPELAEKEAARIALASSVMGYNDLVHVARLGTGE